MLDGMVRLLPSAEVGFLGMMRNEETLEAIDLRQPAARRPHRPPGASSSTRCSPPAARSPWRSSTSSTAGADDITAVCLLAAPEGIAHLEESSPTATSPSRSCTGAIDERLNEKGYIVPGLGDAGDRLYGVV